MNDGRPAVWAALSKLSIYVALYCVTAGIIFSVFALNPEESTQFEVFRILIISCAMVLLTKYFFYMLISPWYEAKVLYRRSRKSEAAAAEKSYPRVSVLVPAWNEEYGVITTVGALLESTYKNMEIIVINNASTDNTDENVMQLLRNHQDKKEGGPQREIDLKYYIENIQGKGHALNRGIREATGDIIVSIDADCFVPKDTIERFVSYFDDPGVMAVVGNVKIGNTGTILGVIQYLEYLFSFYFKKGEALINSIYIIGGAAGAFRKEVFEKLGGYNTENITEDIELSVRIQDAGMKIAYAPDGVVYTEGANDLQGLMRQRLRWKRGRFDTFRQHKQMFFSTSKKHNKVLSWIVMPLAIFGDIQLSFELLFIFFLYIFSYFVNDFSSFISGIVVVSSMFAIQILFDQHRKSRVKFLLLAPIGWLLFYVSTFVESNALIRTITGHLSGTSLKWQNWSRRGVF